MDETSRKEYLKNYHREYYINNKEKLLQRNSEWRKNNPELAKLSTKKWQERNSQKIIEDRYQNDYGISCKDYEGLLKTQKNKCAICSCEENALRGNKVRKLCVDHNHKTGKIRGLLCNKCNMAMGLLNDDVQLLRNMLEFLNVNS